MDQLLYKVMSRENFRMSVEGNYLHFNRVDRYPDFPESDQEDSEQLPRDRPVNEKMSFQKEPEYTLADYYDRSRSRTYVCCWSTENLETNWIRYGNEGGGEQVCIVTRFGKLRDRLNQTLSSDETRLMAGDIPLHQIFSINYGLVEYVDWTLASGHEDRLPNPIQYAYFKNDRYSNEREFRISLAAFGFGEFMLDNGKPLGFSDSLQMHFDYRAAIADKTIENVIMRPDADFTQLAATFKDLDINAVVQN